MWGLKRLLTEVPKKKENVKVKIYRHERVQIGHNLLSSNKEKLQIIKCDVIVGMVNRYNGYKCE